MINKKENNFFEKYIQKSGSEKLLIIYVLISIIISILTILLFWISWWLFFVLLIWYIFTLPIILGLTLKGLAKINDKSLLLKAISETSTIQIIKDIYSYLFALSYLIIAWCFIIYVFYAVITTIFALLSSKEFYEKIWEIFLNIVIVLWSFITLFLWYIFSIKGLLIIIIILLIALLFKNK